MTSASEDGRYRHYAAVSIGAVAVAVVLVSGCSGQRNDGRIAVVGRVIYDGQPVRVGRVLFATSSGHGDSAVGLDERGGFRAKLFPGDYAVVVRATDGFEHLDEKGNLVLPAKLVPVKYFDAKTSGLVLTVTAGMKPVELTLQP